MHISFAECVLCKSPIIGKRKDAKYCSSSCSNKVHSQTWRDSGKEKSARKTPKYRYHIHKTNARSIGTEFKLTFDEWWSVWKPYFAEDNYGKLCMCRTNDEGAYEIGNVRIDTWQNNYREARQLPLV